MPLSVLRLTLPAAFFITPCLSKEAEGKRIYYHRPPVFIISSLYRPFHEYNYWVYGDILEHWSNQMCVCVYTYIYMAHISRKKRNLDRLVDGWKWEKFKKRNIIMYFEQWFLLRENCEQETFGSNWFYLRAKCKVKVGDYVEQAVDGFHLTWCCCNYSCQRIAEDR